MKGGSGMDSVADERSRLRRHVRAAREWLGKAEASLDRAEDVQGDLNLMLAQAELTRAKETERPGAKVVWARRIAAFSVAALLAGASLWAWRAGVPPAQEPPLAEQRIEQPAGMSQAPIVTAPPPAANPLPVRTGQEAAAESPPMQEALVGEAEEPVPEPAVTMQETETPPADPLPREASLPSEDMQRLMNSAGQSLRATHINGEG